jgi:hypothetical protein
LVPATAFLEVSTIFFYGVAKGCSVELNRGNNNNNNNNKLKQKHCNLTENIIIVAYMIVNGF